MGRQSTLKDQVEHCLRDIPRTRNSDITLMQAVWWKFYNDELVHLPDATIAVRLTSLHTLPREDNIKRIRAKIQNEEHRFLPTEWAVAKKRGIEESEWREFLGYPPHPGGME